MGLTAANPAAAAYSLRKLSTDYTGSAIRVTKDNSTFQDIGFDVSGNLNETALTTFAAGGTVYVSTWYDQSGNGRNATQATHASRPVIVSSGVINKINGKPSILFNSSPIFLNWTGTPPSFPMLMNFVASYNNAGDGKQYALEYGYRNNLNGVSLGASNNVGTNMVQNGTINYLAFYNTSATFSYGTLNTASWYYEQGTTPTFKAWANGLASLQLSGVANNGNPTGGINIGRRASLNENQLYGNISEMIIIPQESARPTIESNQATYYLYLAPVISYTSPSDYIKDIAIATLSPVSSGGAVVSYAVSPALPAGLTLNTSTGDITGTPTIFSAATTYTITATNSFGSTSTTLSITVSEDF